MEVPSDHLLPPESKTLATTKASPVSAQMYKHTSPLLGARQHVSPGHQCVPCSTMHQHSATYRQKTAYPYCPFDTPIGNSGFSFTKLDYPSLDRLSALDTERHRLSRVGPERPVSRERSPALPARNRDRNHRHTCRWVDARSGPYDTLRATFCIRQMVPAA